VAKLYRYEAQASARRKRAFLDLCGGKTNILRMVAAEAERSVAEPQYLGWMVPPQAVSAESSRAALTRKWKRRVIDAGVPPVIYVKTQ
jgi:hypothetical protein